MTRKGEIPLSRLQLIPGLRTGEPVPDNLNPIETSTLFRRAEQGRVLRVPRTLGEIQERIKAHTGSLLDEKIVGRFDPENVQFVELVDVRSRPHIFLGYEKNGTRIPRSPDKAILIIEMIRRTSGGYFVGIPPRSDRLLPTAIRISGVDQETGRILALSYGIDDARSLVQSKTHTNFYVRPINPDFILHRGRISGSVEEDQIEEGNKVVNIKDPYVQDYDPGYVTNAMVARARHTDGMIFFRIDDTNYVGRRMYTIGAPDVSIESNPDTSVVLGRNNVWNLTLPTQLPKAA